MATDNVTGMVKRLYPDRVGCRIRLDDQTPGDKPKDDYYLLELEHPNYAALFSLALAAATGRLPLRVDTSTNIDSQVESPKIDYLVIEWPS